jgi:hypothetical protein
MVHKTPTERFRGNLDYNLVGVIPPYAPLQRNTVLETKHIVVVAGDRGGLNAFLPVIPLALSAGHTISFYFVGTCAKQYDAGEIRLPPRISVTTGDHGADSVNFALNNLLPLDLLVVCASQSAEGASAGMNAVDRIHITNRPILAIEDLYGSLGPLLRQSVRGSISSICVMDEFARDLLARRHPNTRKRIVVTGGPQFDRIIHTAKNNLPEQRTKLRKIMGVNEKELVFLIVGGINGTAELLEIADQGITIAGVGDRSRIIIRPHQRSTPEDSQLLKQWHKKHRKDWYIHVEKSVAATTDDLLPGVDFVLSGYSTTNHIGILYEKTGTVYVGTPSFKRDLMAEKGLKIPPEVEAGAAWYATTGEEMAHAITEYLLGKKSEELLMIRKNQTRIGAFNDGNAARRVWETAESLLKDGYLKS